MDKLQQESSCQNEDDVHVQGNQQDLNQVVENLNDCTQNAGNVGLPVSGKKIIILTLQIKGNHISDAAEEHSSENCDIRQGTVNQQRV